MISVPCHCGRSFEVDDRHVGDRRRCPKCGKLVRVPDPSERGVQVFEAVEAPRERTYEERVLGQLRQINASLATLVGLLLLWMICSFLYAMLIRR